MKDRRQFTEDQDLYLKKIITQLEEGGLPRQTTRVALQALNKQIKEDHSPLKIFAVLSNNISSRLLEGHFAEANTDSFSKREVILSEYLTN